MGSFCYGGNVLMKVDEVSASKIDPSNFEGYPFQIPTIYLDGVGEEYYPQFDFTWSDDSVVYVRNDHLVTYTQSCSTEILAEDAEGNEIWVNGKTAPYSSCWDGVYLDERRLVRTYQIEEYDFKTLKKKKFKMVLEEELPFDEWDFKKVDQFAGADKLDQFLKDKNEATTVVVDGVLLRIGSDSDLVIPNGVTRMNYTACSGTHIFDSITIPRTLMDIPDWFVSDVKTKHIHVDEDHPKYYVESGCLIDKQTSTLVWCFAGNVIPKDGAVKRIGRNAFSEREDLESIIIPETITEIGCNAFQKCEQLVSVSIPDSVMAMERGVFRECRSLKACKLPQTLSVIPADTFKLCTNLEKIVLPEGLIKIEWDAFLACRKLTDVMLPDSLELIEQGAFEKSGLITLKLPTGLNEIGYNAFARCNSLKEVAIPEHLIETDGYVFGKRLVKNDEKGIYALEPFEPLNFNSVNNYDFPF